MLNTLLGIIIGVLLCIFSAIIIVSKRNTVERTIKQTVSKFKEKGKVLEPKNEDIEEFINSLPTEHDTTRE